MHCTKVSLSRPASLSSYAPVAAFVQHLDFVIEQATRCRYRHCGAVRYAEKKRALRRELQREEHSTGESIGQLAPISCDRAKPSQRRRNCSLSLLCLSPYLLGALASLHGSTRKKKHRNTTTLPPPLATYRTEAASLSESPEPTYLTRQPRLT